MARPLVLRHSFLHPRAMCSCAHPQSIDERSFLLADLRVSCQEGQWNTVALAAVPLVLLYPVGETQPFSDAISAWSRSCWLTLDCEWLALSMSACSVANALLLNESVLVCIAWNSSRDSPLILMFVVWWRAGIPLFFYSLLQVNKPRLDQAIVKAQLGFLYDGYSKKAWCAVPYFPPPFRTAALCRVGVVLIVGGGVVMEC